MAGLLHPLIICIRFYLYPLINQCGSPSGNVLHVHDLVDFVSEEAEEAGQNAASWLSDNRTLSGSSGNSGQESSADSSPENTPFQAVSSDAVIPALSGDGVGGIVPQFVRRGTTKKDISFMFRPKNRFRDAVITACSGSDELIRKKAIALTPGEMCRVTIPAEKLAKAAEIRFSVEGTIV